MEPSMNGHDHNDDYATHQCIWIHVERKGFKCQETKKNCKKLHIMVHETSGLELTVSLQMQNTEGNTTPSDTKDNLVMSHTIYLALVIFSCMSHLVYLTNTCLLGNIFHNVPFIYIPLISNSVSDPWWQKWLSCGNELIWVKKYLKMWNFN